MPNWCSTVIKFYSEDLKQLAEMHKKFKDIIDSPSTVENDFNNGWMGDFANTFFPELGHDKIDCRGWVDGIDDIEQNGEYSVFTMWTETAWGAKVGIWNEIVKRFYSEVHIAYIAEECGCDYFCVWDETEGQIFFPDSHYVDGCLPTKDGRCEYIEDRYCYGSVKEIQEYLDKTLPFEYLHTDNLTKLNEEIGKLLERYENMHDCDEELYFQASEFAEINPEEFSFLN